MTLGADLLCGGGWPALWLRHPEGPVRQEGAIHSRCPWAVLTPPSQPFPCLWHVCLAGSGGSSRGCCPGTPESSCPTPAGSLGNDVPRLEKPSQGKCQRCPTLLWWLGVFLTACQGPRLCLP